MKKIIFALLFFPSLCFSQGFVLYGGPLYGNYSNKYFNQFAESYNNYNAGSGVKTPLKPWGSALGYDIGAAFYLVKGVGFSLGFLGYSAHSVAEFNDGGKRHFKNSVFSPFIFGIPIHFWRISIHPKMGLANCVIDSYYEYPDGTISYGKDKLLNGVYKTFDFCGEITFSVDVITLEHLKLEVGVSAFGMPGKVETYDDGDWGRNLDINGYPEGLPLDYGAWNSDPFSYDVTAYVHPRSKIYYAFVNLRYHFKSDDE
ncbi:MAG TPA: hypothetical protein VI112_17285 [Bacteroidia bacterium]|jgi:hypothetical protein